MTESSSTEHFSSTLSMAQLLGNKSTAPTVSPSSRMEEEENEKTLERREHIIDLCHMLAWGANPSNGKDYKFHMRCGYWREDDSLPHCPYCLKERTTKFRARGERCRDWLGDNLGILQMNGKKFSRLARKFRKNFVGYWRIPIKDSQVIVLFDSFLYPELSTLSYDDLKWNKLCQCPKGKKYTGSLCYEKKEEVEKCDDDIIVEVEHVIVSKDMDDDNVQKCWDEVMRVTDHLNPAFDKEEIERACGTKMEIFKTEILNAGGKIAHRGTRRKRVSSKSYGWIFNPDNVPSKENLDALLARKSLTYEQAIADLVAF